ncbi:DUF302 domain-containing protein [Nocardia sp. NPDC057030]|uniref:DUF302 domain-containing protein n=1 Tax=unclassified Nocardia TaxID=2637762 RepID=UPI0036361A1C
MTATHAAHDTGEPAVPYPVSVAHSTPQTVLGLRRTVRIDHAGDDIAAGMGALYAMAAATGFAPAGPPSTTYLGEFRPGATTEADFGLPVVPEPFTGANEEVTLRRTDPELFAHVTHRGDYHRIGDAYRALDEWIRGSAFRQAGPPTEVYLVAPDEALDPGDLLTEIQVPVALAELAVRVSAPFAQTVTLVREALSEQGFGVLTEIDVRATLHGKLGVEMEDYRILGACNPSLAHRALDIDRQIGQLLPCNVVVRTEDDVTIVEAADPELLLRDTGTPELGPIAQAARARLAAALATVAQRADATP